MQNFFLVKRCSQIVITDSRSLHALSNSTHEPSDKRVKIDTEIIRDALENKEIEAMQSKPTKDQILDSLTKDNKESLTQFRRTQNNGNFFKKKGGFYPNV